MKKLLFIAVVAAFGLGSVCQAQIASAPRVMAMPQILAAGTGTNWVIGQVGTNVPTMSPINLNQVHNIGWEVQGQTMASTSTLTVQWVLFNDITSIGSTNNSPTNSPPFSWYTGVSNAAGGSIRSLAVPLTTTMTQVGTNWNVDGFQWMVPLYATNAGTLGSNLTLRYFIKPGF